MEAAEFYLGTTMQHFRQNYHLGTGHPPYPLSDENALVRFYHNAYDATTKSQEENLQYWLQ